MRHRRHTITAEELKDFHPKLDIASGPSTEEGRRKRLCVQVNLKAMTAALFVVVTDKGVPVAMTEFADFDKGIEFYNQA